MAKKYIDADQLIAEIDKRYTEYRAKMKTDDFTYYEGMADALDLFEQFLDSLPGQEHPIYELNQILLDWMREAKTDKEQEARFEAYKRFFELYDEYMMQELEQSAQGLDVTDFCKPVDPGIAKCVADHWWEMLGEESTNKQPVEGLDEVAEDRVTENGRFPISEFEEMRIKDIKFGAEWMKAKMLDGAVEGMVCATITGTNAISFLSPLPDELNAGDKVRVIVIKED